MGSFISERRLSRERGSLLALECWLFVSPALDAAELPGGPWVSIPVHIAGVALVWALLQPLASALAALSLRHAPAGTVRRAPGLWRLIAVGAGDPWWLRCLLGAPLAAIAGAAGTVSASIASGRSPSSLVVVAGAALAAAVWVRVCRWLASR